MGLQLEVVQLYKILRQMAFHAPKRCTKKKNVSLQNVILKKEGMVTKLLITSFTCVGKNSINLRSFEKLVTKCSFMHSFFIQESSVRAFRWRVSFVWLQSWSLTKETSLQVSCSEFQVYK